MYNTILKDSQIQNKNILIIGSPRSGTHALGSELAKLSNAKYLGEICKASDDPDPWNEIKLLYNTTGLTIGQIVQMTSKLYLAHDVGTIKHHTIIVNIRRRDKVKQFASWAYFQLRDPTAFRGWHNHKVGSTNVQPHSVEATDHYITQFILEQLLDDYFLPDYNLCYEDLLFTQTNYQKNEFAFPIEQMFSNLDYVKERLANWQYAPEHFDYAK
jgi:hypothetical protein